MSIATLTARSTARLGFRLAFTGLLLVLPVTACDERLPGFARPPPYDAGVRDAGSAELDAGVEHLRLTR